MLIWIASLISEESAALDPPHTRSHLLMSVATVGATSTNKRYLVLDLVNCQLSIESSQNKHQSRISPGTGSNQQNWSTPHGSNTISRNDPRGSV
ncbi:hypothetical protein P691DRAFT_548993 [Macrolepiota fuliginosa MF-IS2]|uniref:Uncharacterized protein n=1 Tax=Macrolepiota fuliginosa MF-IS2 TaxID=1400762 RepID=A0A9P5X1E1_9AGAR|nr:hypothetical protein P691DRAFT_548993 [Macrolepiota fuliginosa MF-IS2]